MVGNDIVDLKEAENASNWQRPRWLDKLFTISEKQLIHNSENPFVMVWRLWSMKEAAYKLFIQTNPSRFYNPKGFECSISDNSGVVEFKAFKCFVQTKITSNYIISEAHLEHQKLTSEIMKFTTADYNKQSKELKSRLIEFVGRLHHLKKNEFGVPTLYNGKEALNVSLTHHGCYGAYAIG